MPTPRTMIANARRVCIDAHRFVRLVPGHADVSFGGPTRRHEGRLVYLLGLDLNAASRACSGLLG